MSEYSLTSIAESNQKVEAVKDMIGSVLDFITPSEYDIRRVRETLEENKAKIEELEKKLEASQGKLDKAEGVISDNGLESELDCA